MKRLLIASVVVSVAALAGAAPVTYQFTGMTSNGTMTVNNGTSSGTVPSGTPFSGNFTFDDAQSMQPVAFGGGVRASYVFTEMRLSMLGTEVSLGPGTIDVFDNLSSSSSGYPIGDSLYVNLSSKAAPNGPINGAQFNFIFLGFVDPTGTAFASAALPPTLALGSFQSAFAEFNYGTQGTPWGAGNTSMLQPLNTLSKISAVPVPPPTITTTSLPNGIVGTQYFATVTASAPNNDSVSLSVAGLPSGLTFDGTNITGTPSVVGTASVVISAVDTVTQLSSVATLSLTVNGAAIVFAPALPDGIAWTPYTGTFAAATGGTGTFSYTAMNLPAGLTLSGTTVSGTPTTAGAYTVTLTATDTSGSAVSAPATLVINDPGPVACSGKNAVESAYVARNPGFIVVNGGLNLLDHLWTTNLNASNTTFLGGLVNWYQTGLILDYSGVADSNGCILSSLTVRPAVTVTLATLPTATVGQPYSTPISVSWGVPPYSVSISGLPAGLTFDGSTNIVGVPTVAGTFSVTVSAVDAVGATSSQSGSLLVNPPAITGNYTAQDSGQAKITAIGAGYLMVGAKKLIWDSNTSITVNTPAGELHVIDSFVKVGMKAQWKGLRDKATNTVLTSRLEIN